ncbi:MAG TPA: substrate-binding domain-containing protein [Beijerinckiaceae bacterium]
MCSAFRKAFPSPLRGGPTRPKAERGGGRGTEGAGVATRSLPYTALRPRDPHPYPSPQGGGETRVPVRARLHALALTLALALSAAPASARELRVCADPNNLPFSNEAREGFENRIVDLIAKDLGATVSYTWWAQRRGFVRNTLKAGLCDLVAGTPANMEMMRTTRPYYRSSYVFVTRADGPQVASFDDPVLREAKVGVHLIGNDGFNTPPAHALSRRGIVETVRGYTIYGDYAQPNPPARLVEAVAKGEVDVAVVWGPLAGYFAPREGVPLKVTSVRPQVDGPRLPMTFDISMGVRREDEAFRQEIDAIIARRKPEIDAILAEYGVPRADPPVRLGAVR